MTAFNTIALVFFATCTSVHGIHQLIHSATCFDTGRTQVTVMFDDDEILYVDFNNQSVVWESRIPSMLHSHYTYTYADQFPSVCHFSLERGKWATSATKTTAAPDVLIYPRDEVIEQIDNTLICLVKHFFPPDIKIHWTKNREVAATDDPFERIIPNSDGTFQVLSMLNFVPKVGDIYSCIVEHETLEKPMVRFFEFHSSGTDIGPTAYCAICLTLGLLGFATGIFLWFKDNYHQASDS